MITKWNHLQTNSINLLTFNHGQVTEYMLCNFETIYRYMIECDSRSDITFDTTANANITLLLTNFEAIAV